MILNSLYGNSNFIRSKSRKTSLFIRSNNQSTFAVKTNVIVNPVHENDDFVLETN